LSIVLSEEQVDFQKTVRAFLEAKITEDLVRRVAAEEVSTDEPLWESFAELELHGLGIPEEHGGAGGSWVELGLVLEEMGAVLVPVPYFATTVLAGQALAAFAPDGQIEEWLERIRKGELVATLALPGRDGWDDDAISVSAGSTAGAWRLRGRLDRVIDASSAELILTVAGTPDGPRLFAVESAHDGVVTTPRMTLDPTRKMASVEFSDAPAIRLGEGAADRKDLERILDLATVGLAAEQLGAARRCLETAVEYAKERFQHGQAIGSFQAIKHRCADIFLAIEAARSCVYHALALAAADDPDLGRAASVAKAAASDAVNAAATGSVQIHGGIGFSWEHPAHLYLKRAKSSGILLGTATDHRERLSRCLTTH